MRQDNGEEDGGRVPALSVDSPWAWFYYSTFAVQIVVVTVYMLRYGVVTVQQNASTAFGIYIATLLEVSVRIPAMAAYSLLIAVTVEAIRVIAERYLAKRFRQGKAEGKAEGISQVLGLLDADTRKEVERKLRRNGNSGDSSEHN